MADIEVRFPKPCEETWEAMSPRGCNRHCASCDTIVHDLAALSVEQAEALLADGSDICVRAQIGRDGVIQTRQTMRGNARRLVAAAGATFALATVACQTVTEVPAPRYQVTGKFGWKDFYYTARLQSTDGRIWPKRREPGTGRFIFDGLEPGIYTLTVEDPCGERVEMETITISDASVEVQERYPDSGCIIVGAMVRAERPERA